jgi:hypothetical protein
LKKGQRPLKLSRIAERMPENGPQFADMEGLAAYLSSARARTGRAALQQIAGQLPGRFHVPTDQGRIRIFEITNRDLKLEIAICDIMRAFCPVAGNDFVEQGLGSKTRSPRPLRTCGGNVAVILMF